MNKRRRQSSGRAHRRHTRESRMAMIDRLLMNKVKAGTKTVTALEAILHQLMRQEMAGNMAAARTLHRYEKLISQQGERKLQILFQDADPTDDLGNDGDG